jgi:hypothetical protein
MLIINVSTPNDHFGDYLRDSFVKVNANFAELADAVALKAPITNPAFIGSPTAPTAALGTNTTQLATTAFVMANGGGNSLYWTAGAGTGSIKAVAGGGTAAGLYGVSTASSFADGNSTFATGYKALANGDYSVAMGYNTKNFGHGGLVGGSGSTNNGDYGICWGRNSVLSAHYSYLFGDNITGTTDNMTYVEKLNIKTAPTGTAVNNLGIDSSGQIVRTPLSTVKAVIYKTGTSWSRDKQFTFFIPSYAGEQVLSVIPTIECVTAVGGFAVGDIVNVGACEPNDSGGTGGHGLGVQYQANSSTVHVNIEDQIFIPLAYSFEGNNGSTWELTTPSNWTLRFVITLM